VGCHVGRDNRAIPRVARRSRSRAQQARDQESTRRSPATLARTADGRIARAHIVAASTPRARARRRGGTRPGREVEQAHDNRGHTAGTIAATMTVVSVAVHRSRRFRRRNAHPTSSAAQIAATTAVRRAAVRRPDRLTKGADGGRDVRVSRRGGGNRGRSSPTKGCALDLPQDHPDEREEDQARDRQQSGHAFGQLSSDHGRPRPTGRAARTPRK